MAKRRVTSFYEYQSRERLKRVKKSQNALHIWEAIEEFAGGARFRDAATAQAWKDPHAMIEMPTWVLWHLWNVADQLLAMGRGHARDSKEDPRDIPAAGEETIAPAAALAEALHVLGFARQGWNAFAAYRRDQLRKNAVCCAYFGYSREELRQYLGLQTDRALSRELSLGRRALPPHEREDVPEQGGD
jgi:hypothetical protein